MQFKDASVLFAFKVFQNYPLYYRMCLGRLYLTSDDIR